MRGPECAPRLTLSQPMTGDEKVLGVGSYRCLIADKFDVEDSTMNQPSVSDAIILVKRITS